MDQSRGEAVCLELERAKLLFRNDSNEDAGRNKTQKVMPCAAGDKQQFQTSQAESTAQRPGS
jgi:hypothetical protein